VQEAVKNKGMFNIIDHKSNYKADIVILKKTNFFDKLNLQGAGKLISLI